MSLPPVLLEGDSSVARGGRGGLEPPHWLVKYAKSHVFGAFEADFLWKIENSPPLENSPPQTFEFRISAEKSVSISVKTFSFFFFFLETTCVWAEKTFEFRISAEKSVSISVKTFFFLETTSFWAEKTFEFSSFPRNSVSIFEQIVWNLFKNNENSGQGRLHFSHSFKIAPPFPNPGYAPGRRPVNKAANSTKGIWDSRICGLSIRRENFSFFFQVFTLNPVKIANFLRC